MDPIQIEACTKLVTLYLDSMPTKSRVTMYDLAEHARTALNLKYKDTYSIVQMVIHARSDFHVYRGMGACKL